MKSEEDKIIRPDHEGGSMHASEESAEFVPGYQPERMTKITVPDLPEDASGMSAEALAKIPTLTEQVARADEQPKPELVAEVVPTPVLVPEPAPDPGSASASVSPPAQEHASDDVAAGEGTAAQVEPSDVAQPEAALASGMAQDNPLEADSWLKQCQVRIDQLSDEIQKLNDRLDQLEKTTKV